MINLDNLSRPVPVEEMYRNSKNPVLKNHALRVINLDANSFRISTFGLADVIAGISATALSLPGVVEHAGKGNIEVSSAIAAICGSLAACLGLWSLSFIGDMRAEATSLRIALVAESIAESKQNQPTS